MLKEIVVPRAYDINTIDQSFYMLKLLIAKTIPTMGAQNLADGAECISFQHDLPQDNLVGAALN